MLKAEINCLEILYATDEKSCKPKFQTGFSLENIVAAKDELLAYYSQKNGLLPPIAGDVFKNIENFISSVSIPNTISEADLKRQFEPTSVSGDERVFLDNALSLVKTMDQLDDIDHLWKTCSYRPIAAVSRSTMDVNGSRFIIGGMGASGAHELFHQDLNVEKSYLNGAILEALLIGGLYIEEDANIYELARFMSEIDSMSNLATYRRRSLLDMHPVVMDFERMPNGMEQRVNKTKEMKVQSPVLNINNHDVDANKISGSMNCEDISLMASVAARNIFKQLGLTYDENRLSEYQYCFMHKYNYDKYYTQMGLEIPAKFGRLACPSHCAETQAELHKAYSVMVSLITGEDEVYVWSIQKRLSNFMFYPTPSLKERMRNVQYVEFNYLVPSPGTAGEYKQRKLIVEDSLSLLNFNDPPNERKYLNVYKQLRDHIQELRRFDNIVVKKDVSFMRDNEYEIAIGTVVESGSMGEEYVLKDGGEVFHPITRIKKSEFIPMSQICLNKDTIQYSEQVPCLHCMNVLKGNEIKTLLIDRVNWNNLKGDDWFGLIALGNQSHRTIILR